ncbi:MAG TPA: class I SAM-dependent methyltransferase [Alphaproteobacteria bacterium]|nr:class I SAM-dependent methyltransferase [Alphaproteobacteria bacterium]
MKKEAEKVNGTWFNYFNKIVPTVFDEQVCIRYENSLNNLYGDFFDRNLSKNKGSLLSIGAGFGMTEIPLARKGYNVIGIDNDDQVIDLYNNNAKNYGNGKTICHKGDLYENFHKDYVGKGVQACISFGVLEHFKREDLEKLIKKQFEISPLIIAMIPVNTPDTLKSFKAEKNPEDNVDENGIYRNFWTADFWEKEIFKNYKVIDKQFPRNKTVYGYTDLAIFAVVEK